MKHTMPELPYAPEALAPKMSKETFDYHYGKHLQTYVNNLNNLIAGTPYEEMPLDEIVRKADGGIFNNAAQAWNHTFFFRMLTPAQQPMPAKLAAKLTEAFGSVEAFKEQFTKAAVGLFGSGWAWLAMDKAGKLSIVAKPNAGNPMTDAILNSKISLAKNRGIPVMADAHIPVKLRIPEIDLCCILGNLFDNAIEASAKLPPEERLIRVYMDMKGSQLYISFTNFTAGKKMVKREGRFATTKGAGHGLGLMRIDSIVERLDGYVNRNSEDGAFTTELLLPQQEEPSSGEAAATQL